MKLVAISAAALFALIATAAAHGHYPDSCTAAFRRCNFRFHGSRFSVPTFSIAGPADKAFTPRLVWKDSSKRVGVVNANNEGLIIKSHGAVPLSKFHTGGQSFTPFQFKPFTIMRKRYDYKHPVATSFSGIGHEVLQGNERAARGKCVFVRFTHYQTLMRSYPPIVTGIVDDANDCVVFKTS